MSDTPWTGDVVGLVEAFRAGERSPLEELDATLAEFREVLDGFSQDSDMYQNIGAAAESLERSLDNVDRLTRKLSDRPSSLISSPPIVADPKPEPRP